jgi:hypothetical protein
MASKQLFKLNFVGDVMLGRLIDQLLPEHVNESEEIRTVDYFRRIYPQLNQYSRRSPWGNTLPLFNEADLNMINLETAITTEQEKWPNKVFN